MEMRSTTASDITKTTDEMLQELSGFASVAGVEEIIGGAGDTQSAANLIEVATDIQEGDGKGDTVFHKREDALSGICTDGEPGSEPILCPQAVSLVQRANAADTSEAVLALDSDPHPLDSEVLFGASRGSADLLSDQSRDLPSGNKGSPPDLVDFEPQAKPKEALHRPTTQNSGRMEAGLPRLELHQKEGGTVISMEVTAQDRTPFAASEPVPEKEGGRVNGKAQVPAEGPSEELVSEREKELLEEEEEQEEVTERVQQQITSEGNCGAQRESLRCRVQSFGEKPSMDGQKSTTSDSKYSTVSYRKIRKGNTKQRIDEFESMMH